MKIFDNKKQIKYKIEFSYNSKVKIVSWKESNYERATGTKKTIFPLIIQGLKSKEIKIIHIDNFEQKILITAIFIYSSK